MSYVAKTDWKHDDPVTEQDLNRWETGIKENTEKLGTVQEFALTTASGDAKESITNVNTATTVGLFLVGSTATGAPTTAVGLLYAWRRGSSHLLQEYWEISSNKRHHRTSTDNGATWTTWQTIANTDVATTSKNGLMSSSDKTALDNAQKVKLTSDGDGAKSIPGSDANNITESGYYVVSVGASNVPEQYGIISHVKRSGTNNIQYFMATGTGNMYVRGGDSSGWRTWRRLTDNSILGGILLGNKLVDTQTANFVGKVSGSTTVNPHIAKASGSNPYTSLQSPPFTGTLSEINGGGTAYPSISSLDGNSYLTGISSNGAIAQHSFSFDLIEHVQRTYGMIPGATTADKVAWLKTNISKLVGLWYGYGLGPQGNKATLRRWDPSTNQWQDMSRVHTSSTVAALSTSGSSNYGAYIDTNGFFHLLAYADPSDGVTSSVINTDYVELQIELSTSLKDNMKPLWIDATLQSGWVEFQTALKPQYSIGFDGYVTLKGGIKSGTLSTTAMTLPVGYRPTKSTYFLVPGDTNSKSFYRITVQQDGQVLVVHFGGTSNNDFVSLDGIRFPTN